MEQFKWKTSSRSGSEGNCVEVAITDDAIYVRDTKDREGGTLMFTAEEWRAFIGGARDGEFDN